MHRTDWRAADLARLSLDEETVALGVDYRSWGETWPWMEDVQGRFERFDRLLPAMQGARRLNGRATRNDAGVRVIRRRPLAAMPSGDEVEGQYLSEVTDTLRNVPCVTPRHPRDTAFREERGAETDLRPIRVYSEEKRSSDGTRSVWTFFTTDYITLWKQMASRKLRDVHYYEILEEGLPCHLYFDLEFLREFNRNVDGNALVELLLNELEHVMQRRWHLSLANAFVMEMDASTETKFSRHLIIRLKDYAFRSNTQMKWIVQEILSRVATAFTVQKASGTACFIDEAVYTKNRSFRMLWCSKNGKQNQLKPSKRFSLAKYTGSGKRHTQRLLYLSLIGNVNPGVRLLDIIDDGGSPCSVLHTASKTVRSQGRAVELQQRSQVDHGPCYYEERAIACVPVIEDLVRHLSKEPATVTKVLLLGYDGLVSYNIVGPGSHYCFRIGRAHKSNHVYYLVDLQYLKFQQRCYDPECDNRQASWDSFPSHLLPSLHQHLPHL